MTPYPPLKRADLVPYGRVRRSHGHQGDIVLEVYTEELFQLDPEFLILEKEGLLVPFPVEAMRGSRKQLITSLDFLTSEELAKSYSGSEVYLHKRELTPQELEELKESSFSLLSFTLIHTTGKTIGIIEDIDDSTPNLLLQVRTPQAHELLLPYVEEWITSIDEDKQTITFDCPIELTDPL